MSIKNRSDYELESRPIASTSLDLYKYQVGGHGMKMSKKDRILGDGSGIIYKPVQKFPIGENEIKFYQHVFENDRENPVLMELKKFIPKFLGVFSYNDPTKDNLYIGIDDLLVQFKQPSVADVKLGQRSFEPSVPEQKQQREINKYIWRETVGFLITGIRVNDSNPVFLDRFYGRRLDPEDVYHKGIKVFLGSNPMKAKALAGKFISKLLSLLDWFKGQKQMAFVASSLLMAYDNRNYKSICNGEIDTSGLFVGNVVVKLIDFSHVRSVEDYDHNCIYGIESLIKYFKRVQIDSDY